MDESKLAGMTTNERLFLLGVMEQFHAARDERDLATMRRLLELAKIDEPSIALILSRTVDAE